MVLLCSTLLRFTLHIKGMSKSLGLSFFGNSVQSRLSTGRPAEPDAADEEGTTHQQPHPPDVDAHTTFRMCPHYLSSRILNKLPNRSGRLFEGKAIEFDKLTPSGALMRGACVRATFAITIARENHLLPGTLKKKESFTLDCDTQTDITNLKTNRDIRVTEIGEDLISFWTSIKQRKSN
ncbi:hypothetical protein Fcan01_07075 [Folsomia candida]|uniref:Uncharacterized protein n=1 Tax=Folsomia candida TaxID=158441 RepID=A0A226EMC8_FOLCA|nr:hypothetical protein Fcan01_07075 [Folsomia candida]